ncbi:putative 2OG-Fe(II) oxygenase [Sandarakinorhabdus sp.]|uniref:putative 2OG-Fe(II) oxygenase n=1 Tax=Sandarakinorhabdus sp. TaxID=1916663 RepID=UPI003F70611F
MDINALFARAERAFSAGQHAAARADLAQVLRLAGPQAPVLHLVALNEARAGQAAAARAAFGNAIKAAPNDAQVLNNYANFLNQQGEAEAALKQYDAALHAAPKLHQARLNRAILLNTLGRHAAARGDVDALLAMLPNDPAVRQTSGAIHLASGHLADAATDFDAVLAQRPQDLKALHGRARVAAMAGDEALAIGLYRAALDQAPDDGELALGLAEALEAAGEDGAIIILEQAVTRSPAWRGGQDALARMRAEAGAGDAFDASYRLAIAARPDDAPLALAHVACLFSADRWEAALTVLDAVVARHGRNETSDLYEAMLATNVGDTGRAQAALTRVGPVPQAALTRARLALRTGDPGLAASVLEPLARADLNAVNLWAHLDIAWRLLGDARHQWLSGQEGLVATQDIEYAGDWAELAAVLRGLHHARAHPIGQSLRGGTQTRGRLFGRPEPTVKALGEAISAAVLRHVGGLPPADPGHPLLRDRHKRPEFSGSWSVRLVGGGFHVAHIHPAGRLSSACYIVLPEGIDAPDQPGWLEVGGPPAELGLELKPLHLIRPQPKRLALFPSTLFHGTRPFPAGERMTVAFDVVLT